MFSNTIWSLSARIITNIIKIIAVIYLARILGPSEFGIFTLIISTTVLFSVFVDLGISPATARLLSEGKWNSRNIILLSTKILFSIYIVFALLIYFYGEYFFNLINAEDLNSLLLYFIALIFIQSFQKFYEKCFEGLRRIDVSSKISILLEWSTWGLAIISVILLGPTAKSAILGKITGSGLLLTGFAILMWTVVFKNNSNRERSVVNIGVLSKTAFPMLITAISFFIYTHSDILIIQTLLGEEKVGVYGVAVRMLDTLHVPAAAIGSALAAFFVTTYQIGSAKSTNLFYDSTKLILIIYFPLSIGLIVTSIDLFPAVFGLEYSQAGIIAIIYAPTFLFKSLSATYSLALDYMGYASKRALAISISAISNIILNFVLIPKYGIIGAAIATQITYLPVVIWYGFLLSKLTNSSIRLLLKGLKPIVNSSLAMGLTIIVINKFFHLNVFVLIIIGIGVYLLSAWKFNVLSKEEIYKIKGKLKLN